MNHMAPCTALEFLPDTSMDSQLALPTFLLLLTSNNVPIPKAMIVASKVSV